MFSPGKELEINCSIYNCAYLKEKTIMILVPHQDDELIVAGAILPVLRANNCNIKVVFSTNGDYKGADVGMKRLEEALLYCGNEGIPEENVFFMGFGDQGEKGRHIYNSETSIKTPAGCDHTYALDKHLSVATQYFGSEKEYLRKNYKEILKTLLINVFPDIIICIDCDIHSDHIALSLMFEEVLSELIRERNFCPKVLKAFAHDMSWMGVKDYSGINLKSCIPIEKNPHHTYAVQFQNAYYAWEDRVRFPVFYQYVTSGTRNNQFRKTMQNYRSQHVKFHFNRLLNSDQIFWERRTDNLVYRSRIKVSSGEVKCFYTLKMFECENVMLKQDILEKNRLFWRPDIDDEVKKAEFYFDDTMNVEVLNIYTGFDQYVTRDVEIRFDDQITIHTGVLKNYGKKNEIRLDPPVCCKKISLQLSDSMTQIVKFEAISYVKEELYYTKIMINNNFVYRYYQEEGKKIPKLQVYEYGNKGSRVIEEKNIEQFYSFYWIEGKGKKAINNMKEIFDKKNQSKRVHMESKSNPALFDEIEVRHCSKWYVNYIMLQDKVQSLLNDILYKLIRMLRR